MTKKVERIKYHKSKIIRHFHPPSEEEIKILVTLRRATMDDLEKLLEWRNDPRARKNFFNQEAVTLTEHQRWLRGVLENQSRHLFIIINESGELIGQTRFDVIKDEAEISITISPEYRGHGYGTQGIILGSMHLFKNYPEVKKIIARIKADNIFSIKAFLTAGFVEYKKDKDVVSLFFKKSDCPSL